ncbi:MAG: D-alanyl-D-alanine carboxypeptidase [Erysipelotrichaceae bacterium]|nr:MAG: D-alanyl-D-alanine [Erysipelotrichaceae bacterium]TXT18074.1 MAG: D-alanyl-D-alanine carboxypeptidase [Erysipelotrichaceae bacterium]
MKVNKPLQSLIIASLIFLLGITTLRLIVPKHQAFNTLSFVNEKLITQGYSLKETQRILDQLPVEAQIRLSTQPYQKYVVERELYPFFESLFDLGYTKKEINVLGLLDRSILIQVIEGKVIEDPVAWFNTDFFLPSKMIRYLDFQRIKPSYSYRKIVELVNTNRDREVYTETILADFEASILLVNKYHYVPKEYVPDNLVEAKGCGRPTLQADAANAYDLMCQAITDAKLPLSTSTSYRSYAFQSILYNQYLKIYGKAETDQFSARPGYSEHQTGLAVDVNAGVGGMGLFINSDSYDWMIANAHRFGFILRYPQGKEDVTGYQFESWHYTYVGVDIANWIKTKGITLDEATHFIQ